MSEIDTILERDLSQRDPDRWLSSRFVSDARARARLVALYALDGEWARVAGAVSTPLAGEIRLAWWRDAVEAFAAGGPAEHPALEALGREAAASLQPLLLVSIEARHAGLEGEGSNETAVAALMAAAARLLDPASPPGAARAAAHAWAAGHSHALAAANDELKQLPEKAFPAVAHVTLVRVEGRPLGGIEKRLRIAWAVLRGRL